MRASMIEILYEAEKKSYAVGCFNTPTLEMVRGVVKAAEELETPVIIAHAEIHQEYIPIEVIGPIMLEIAERAKIPVCVHLDHGKSLDLIIKAIDMGFNSIMFDGANLPYQINKDITSQIVRIAHDKGVSVEGVIGTISATSESSEKFNNSTSYSEDIFTDPEQAANFAEETGIDALAVSFGTLHGVYSETPLLDFNRLKKIYESVRIPLVMHGGSGLKKEEYHEAIKNGIRKINYYSYMAKEVSECIKKKLDKTSLPIFYHDITKWAVDFTKSHVVDILKVFTNKD